MAALQELLGDLKISETYQDETVSRGKGITVWVPEEYYQKYHDVQGRTKKQFGKRLKKMIMGALDLVPEKAS